MKDSSEFNLVFSSSLPKGFLNTVRGLMDQTARNCYRSNPFAIPDSINLTIIATKLLLNLLEITGDKMNCQDRSRQSLRNV